MKMALQQAGGGERVSDRRSALLLRMSGTRCRRIWEVQDTFCFFLVLDKLNCFSDKLCVFQEIGWLDGSFEFDNATAIADIATLPQEVNICTAIWQ